MKRSVLIVFVKNPRPGDVKTRLAESVGDEKALQIYEKLLNYTRSVIEPLSADVRIQVWFSGYIPDNDFWEDMDIGKRVQQGSDLGERMNHACATVFSEGFERAVVIGSDCADLTTPILAKAFKELERNDVVIGPSEDGGYYLIGMSALYRTLFRDKPWSTPRLLRQTMDSVEREGLACSLLEPLNDVDNGRDWERAREKLSGY